VKRTINTAISPYDYPLGALLLEKTPGTDNEDI
jgi:hypothetical protein